MFKITHSLSMAVVGAMTIGEVVFRFPVRWANIAAFAAVIPEA